METLKSQRIDLKALSEIDIPALFDYYSDKSNFPYVQMPEYKSLDEVTNYLHRMQVGIDEGKWFLWGIYLSNTDTLVGTISLWNFSEDRSTAEFGYGLFPSYRGLGYMSEALKTCVTYGFNILGLSKIEAYTQSNNLPSINLLRKQNFVYSSTIVEDGEEMVIYYINKVEY